MMDLRWFKVLQVVPLKTAIFRQLRVSVRRFFLRNFRRCPLKASEVSGMMAGSSPNLMSILHGIYIVERDAIIWIYMVTIFNESGSRSWDQSYLAVFDKALTTKNVHVLFFSGKAMINEQSYMRFKYIYIYTCIYNV